MTSPRTSRRASARHTPPVKTARSKQRRDAAPSASSVAQAESGPEPTNGKPKKRSPAKAGAAAGTRAKSAGKAAAKASTATRTRSTRGGAESRRPRTAAQREASFDALVRGACLKAGTAAAISSITGRVPLLGRLAPTVLGPLAETVALAQVQKQMVVEIVELYEVALSEPEMRGVVLLATATHIGAQQLSKRSMDAILKQFGEGLIGTVAARVLPMATILAEITAAVASTYTVAKRAQALCKLPGTGAGNLADLLRGLSGIDQQRLLSWSGEAFRLALVPFRSVLGMLWR
jgi:uncharacterized protein (DUF697 family)